MREFFKKDHALRGIARLAAFTLLAMTPYMANADAPEHDSGGTGCGLDGNENCVGQMTFKKDFLLGAFLDKENNNSSATGANAALWNGHQQTQDNRNSTDMDQNRQTYYARSLTQEDMTTGAMGDDDDGTAIDYDEWADGGVDTAINASSRVDQNTDRIAAALTEAVMRMNTGQSALNAQIRALKRLCDEHLINPNLPEYKDALAGTGCNGAGGGGGGAAAAAAGGAKVAKTSTLGGCAATLHMPKGVKTDAGGRLTMPPSDDADEQAWEAAMEMCIAKQCYHPTPSGTGTPGAVVQVYWHHLQSIQSNVEVGACVREVMRHTVVTKDAAGDNEQLGKLATAQADAAGANAGMDKCDVNNPDKYACGGGGGEPYSTATDVRHDDAWGPANPVHTSHFHRSSTPHELAQHVRNWQGKTSEENDKDCKAWQEAMKPVHCGTEDFDVGAYQMGPPAPAGGGAPGGQLYVPPKSLISGISLKDLFGPPATPVVSQNGK
jgi:hypothetical protein